MAFLTTNILIENRIGIVKHPCCLNSYAITDLLDANMNICQKGRMQYEYIKHH